MPHWVSLPREHVRIRFCIWLVFLPAFSRRGKPDHRPTSPESAPGQIGEREKSVSTWQTVAFRYPFTVKALSNLQGVTRAMTPPEAQKRPMTCENISARYWDRTSDLFRVNCSRKPTNTLRPAFLWCCVALFLRILRAVLSRKCPRHLTPIDDCREWVLVYWIVTR